MSTMEHHEKVRPYGPEDGTEHKFETILDAYVYNASLDGCDDEVGWVEDQGWAGLFRGPFHCTGSDPVVLLAGPIPIDDCLNGAEISQLNACAGIIIREDRCGGVDVDYYDTADGLELAWGLVQACEMEWLMDPANAPEWDCLPRVGQSDEWLRWLYPPKEQA